MVVEIVVTIVRFWSLKSTFRLSFPFKNVRLKASIEIKTCVSPMFRHRLRIS